MKLASLLFAFTLLALSYSAKAQPATFTHYYVDNSGSPACSDSNPGTSQSAPWCTVAHAMTQITSLSPGNSILFKCGDVWNESMIIPNNAHGSAGNPITIGHYGTSCAVPSFASYDGTNTRHSYRRNLPALNGGSTRTNGIIAHHSTGVSYLTIDGFDVHDFTVGGINFVSPSCGGMPGITITNNAVHENGGGAYAGATEGPDSTLAGACDAAAPNGPGPCDNRNYDIDGGINFNDDCAAGGNDGVQITHNAVWDQGGHNTLRVHFDNSPNTLVAWNVVGPGCFHNCIDTKGINARIQYNITTCPASTQRSPGGFGQCDAGNAGLYTEIQGGTFTEHPIYEYNVAYNIGICGQIVGGNTSGGGVAPSWRNNTCHNAYGNGALYTSSLVAPCTIEKNILGGPTAVHDSSGANCTWDYNDDFGATANPVGKHDIRIDPNYVNPTGALPDFHPQNSTVLTGAIGAMVTSSSYFGALAGP